MTKPILTGNSIVVARINRLIAEAGPNSKSLRAAFHKVGMAIAGQAVLNATAQGIVDTGSLRAHIGYEFFSDGATRGIKVGAFGVPYAALHEFGGPFTDRMRRAMFASLKRRGKMQPGAGPKRSKGVIVNGWFRARPYLIPAFRTKREYAVQTIREALLAAARGE